MKTVVILAGHTNGSPSPTGNIAVQLSGYLKSDFRVFVVGIGMRNSRVVIDNVTHISLTNVFLKCQTRISKIQLPFVRVILIVVSKFLHRLYQFVPRSDIQVSRFLPDANAWYFPKAMGLLETQIQNSELDILVTISSPFITHQVGMEIKRRYSWIKWHTYVIDPYTRYFNYDSISMVNTYHAKKHYHLEAQIFTSSDFNWATPEVYNEIKDKSYGSNVRKLNYVIVDERKEIGTKNYFDSNFINVVYAGSFYKHLRNPEFILQCFSAVQNTNIKLHLFVSSDCDTIIDRMVEKSKGKILRHSYKNPAEMDLILNAANVLVSVGNLSTLFRPSKTFKYIGLGKPVIHFNLMNREDEIFSRYPIALQITQASKELVQCSKEIEEFCVRNAKNSVEFDEVGRLFPEHMAREINNIILTYIDI